MESNARAKKKMDSVGCSVTSLSGIDLLPIPNLASHFYIEGSCFILPRAGVPGLSVIVANGKVL